MVEKKLGVVEKMLWRLRKVALFARFIRKNAKSLQIWNKMIIFATEKSK